MNSYIQQFQSGESLLVEGEKGDRVFKILEGNVIVYKTNEKSERIELAKLGKGDIVGEMYLWDKLGARSATVVAVNNVRCEVIPEETMLYKLQPLNEAQQEVYKSLTRKVQKTSNQYTQK